jgi:hypothetical protein
MSYAICVYKAATLCAHALSVAEILVRKAVASFKTIMHIFPNQQSICSMFRDLLFQFSHIHLHDAEKSLLEAIALLLTSCICVPLVVSKVPGMLQ